jgi:hypothetical protein
MSESFYTQTVPAVSFYFVPFYSRQTCGFEELQMRIMIDMDDDDDDNNSK